MFNKKNFLFIVLIVVLLALSRLVKHPFNFTPVAAMSIFAGCYLQKRWAIFIPLAAMFISDYFIGFYDWKLMAFVYFSIAIAYFIGALLRKYKKWHNVMLASLASSIVFFILTNFSVWALYEWYPKTWAGLLNCFTLALPFFRNTLLGDLVYSGALFSLYEIAVKVLAWRAVKKEAVKI